MEKQQLSRKGSSPVSRSCREELLDSLVTEMQTFGCFAHVSGRDALAPDKELAYITGSFLGRSIDNVCLLLPVLIKSGKTQYHWVPCSLPLKNS